MHSGQFRIGYYLGLSSEMRYAFMQNRKFCSAGRNFGLQVQKLACGQKSLHLGYKYKKPTLGLQTQRKPAHLCRLNSLVASTGFEPAISALRGRRPKPLDDEAIDA